MILSVGYINKINNDLKITFNNFDIPSAKYDLSLYVIDSSNEIKLDLVYVSPLYSDIKIKKILTSIFEISHKVLSGGNRPLSEIGSTNQINKNVIGNSDISDFEFDEFDFSMQ